jgi:predicted secreted protein
MKLTLAIVLYIFIWWITLFTVLPFHAHSQEDEGNVVPGTPESAPAKVRIVRIFLTNTVVAAVVFAIAYAAIVNHWSLDFTTFFDNAYKSSPIPPPQPGG